MLEGRWDCSWRWVGVGADRYEKVSLVKSGRNFTAIGVPLWEGTKQWLQSIDIYGFGEICTMALMPPNISNIREQRLDEDIIRFEVIVKSPGSRGVLTTRVLYGGTTVYLIRKTLDFNVRLTPCHELVVYLGPIRFLVGGSYTLVVEYVSEIGVARRTYSFTVKGPSTPVNASVVYVTNATIPLEGLGTVRVILADASRGLSGYSLELTTRSACLLTLNGECKVAEVGVVEVKFPDWARLSNWTRIDEYTIKLKAVDLGDAIRPGARDVVLAEITVRGLTPGVAYVTIHMPSLDNDEGRSIPVTVKPGVITVLGCPRPIAGVMPRDLDRDGLYEDINGNGRLDYDDLVRLFKHFEDQAVRECWRLYDFNRNGRLDFGDIVELFRKVP